jgi:hypothetical protein
VKWNLSLRPVSGNRDRRDVPLRWCIDPLSTVERRDRNQLDLGHAGLKIYGAGRWLEEKHGARTLRNWRKLRLVVDADSGEIIADRLIDQDTDDPSQVELLFSQIDGDIGQFTADGAYDGKPTHRTVLQHSATANVVIPPRSTAVKSGHTGPPGQRDKHIATIAKDGRLKWQAATTSVL